MPLANQIARRHPAPAIAEILVSESARWHLSRDAAARAAARVLAAASVLLLAEIILRAPAGGLSDAGDLAVLSMGVIALTCLAEAGGRLGWWLCRRLSPRHPMVWLVLFGLPLVFIVWPSDPWSGGPGPLVLLTTALVLSATLVGAVQLSSSVDSARVRRRVRRWAPLAVTLALVCSLASGSQALPRPVSLWLAGLAVLFAVLFGRLMVTPAARPALSTAALGLSVVLASLVGLWREWDEPRWTRLSMLEGGLLPGFREVVARPLRALARDDAGGQSRPGALHEPAPSLRVGSWRVVSGVAVVTPEAGAPPVGEGSATSLSLRTPDAVLEWSTPPIEGSRGVRAQLWVRPVSAGPPPILRVSLWGPGEPVQRVVRLGDDWTQLSIESTLDAPLSQSAPPLPDPASRELDLSAARPEGQGAWWLPLPPSFERAISDGESRLVLLEDGQPLGPRTADHELLREVGGAFDSWMGGVVFRTPDGSDPRSNGRRYTAQLAQRRGLVQRRLSLYLGLVNDDLPVELLVWDARFDGWPADDMASRDPREQLRFRPTSGGAVEALRRATRHVVVLVTPELAADFSGQPALRELARVGQNVARVYAPSDHGAAALASLASGLPPPVILAVQALDAPLPTWLASLREAGFHTFVQGMGADTPGLEAVHAAALEHGQADPRAVGLEDELIDELRTHADERVAVLARWGPALDGRSSFDDRLARFLAGLSVMGLHDEVLLVVTSLRGVGGDEGGRNAARSDAALRVPFVLRLPGDVPPRELEAPTSLTALGPTLLDVAAPTATGFADRPGLIEALLDGPRETALPPPVLAWTEGARVMWLGSAKFVRDERLGGQLLYDLTSDPGEFRPLYDEARITLLARQLADEERRLEALTRGLVSRHESELRDDLLAGLLVRELDAESLRPMLDGFWGLNGATRRFLLETIYARGVLGLRESLDALSRRRFERDDQLLLVLRVWAGSERAADELAARLGELEPTARRWLFEMLPDLPAGFVREVADALLEELRALHAGRPSPGSDAEREYAAGLAGLASVLGSRVDREVKSRLVELQGSWADAGLRPFATLRDPSFGEETLLDAIAASLAVGDELLLRELRPDEAAARRLPELFARLDAPAARSRLLELIDVWGQTDAPTRRMLSHLVPGLRRHFDADFSREAIQRVERWRTSSR